MKKLMLMMAIAMICLGAMATQKKETVQKRVPVTAFDKIAMAASVDVIYTQGSTYECSLIASPKDMDKLKIEVVNKQLNISVENPKKTMGRVIFNSGNFTDKVVVKVSSPLLTKVDCVGSGDFVATSDIKTDNLLLNISGSGEIELKKVSGHAISLNVAGSGDISLQQATAKNLKVSVAGSGEVDIDQAVCQVASLSIAGSGDIDAAFSTCQDLKCSVAGSGEMELKGMVTNYSGAVTGSGEIIKSGLQISGNCVERGKNPIPAKTPKTINNINPRP